MQEISLNGIWKIKAESTDWLDCTVPGTQYTALINSGKIADPFLG
jgi:hypothetical protein